MGSVQYLWYLVSCLCVYIYIWYHNHSQYLWFPSPYLLWLRQILAMCFKAALTLLNLLFESSLCCNLNQRFHQVGCCFRLCKIITQIFTISSNFPWNFQCFHFLFLLIFWIQIHFFCFFSFCCIRNGFPLFIKRFHSHLRWYFKGCYFQF